MNLTAKQTETLEIVAAAGQISFYDKAITKVSVSALVRKGLLVIDADTYMVSLAAPAAVETEVEVATETAATETVEVAAAPVATETVEIAAPVAQVATEIVPAPVTAARTHWVTVDYTDEITGEVQRITDWYGTRSVARRAARFAQRHPRAALVGTSF